MFLGLLIFIEENVKLSIPRTELHWMLRSLFLDAVIVILWVFSNKIVGFAFVGIYLMTFTLPRARGVYMLLSYSNAIEHVWFGMISMAIKNISGSIVTLRRVEVNLFSYWLMRGLGKLSLMLLLALWQFAFGLEYWKSFI